MAPARRHLIVTPRFLTAEEWERDEAEWLASCPQSARYDEREVCEFLAAAFYLDRVPDRDMVQWLKENRIPFPPAFTFDCYRLSRYLLHHWHSSEIRQALHYQVLFLDRATVSAIRRKGRREDLLKLAFNYTPPVAIWVLQISDLADRISDLMDALPPELLALHRTLLLRGRRLMYQCLTEPPQPRTTQWDRKKLLRRMNHRDLQLHSMRKNLYRLRRERKALLDKIRQAGAEVPPELDQLATDLQRLRRQRSEAEARHARALADLHARFDRELAGAEAELAEAGRECLAALALLRPWGSESGARPAEPLRISPPGRRRSRWP